VFGIEEYEESISKLVFKLLATFLRVKKLLAEAEVDADNYCYYF